MPDKEILRSDEEPERAGDVYREAEKRSRDAYLARRRVVISPIAGLNGKPKGIDQKAIDTYNASLAEVPNRLVDYFEKSTNGVRAARELRGHRLHRRTPKINGKKR